MYTNTWVKSPSIPMICSVTILKTLNLYQVSYTTVISGLDLSCIRLQVLYHVASTNGMDLMGPLVFGYILVALFEPYSCIRKSILCC